MPAKKKSASSGVKIGSFEALTRDYLASLQTEYEKAVATGEATPELSYRPSLHDFLRNLAAFINPEVEVIFEPRKQANAKLFYCF